MPLVLTDFTNKTWAIEHPTDGYLHAGRTGQSGVRLVYLLEFIEKRQKQFDKFVEKKELEERARSHGRVISS